MPTITVFDAATGEIIERQMNDDELSQYEADKAAAPTYPEETTTE
jgi:hypothetical protein